MDLKNQKVKMSRPLIRSLHLDININKNLNNKNYGAFELELEHWYELCHPEDHGSLINFENFIFDKNKNFITLDRRLYCGDGVYRRFCLDAFVERDKLTGEAVRLFGVETLSRASALNIPVMSALQAVKLLELFAVNHRSQFNIKGLKAVSSALENLSRKLSDNNNNFLIGISGLSGSGKTEFINALNIFFEKFAEKDEYEALKFIDIAEFNELKNEFEDVNSPECDIILYLIPARAALTLDDAELLNALNETGASGAVILTRIDVERDATQAGEVIMTRAEILDRNIKNLSAELADIGIDWPVIPVSSKFALENNDASNFEPLIKYIKNIYDCRLFLRGTKALKLADRALNCLDVRRDGADVNVLDAAAALHESINDIKSVLDEIKIKSGGDINFSELRNFNFNFNFNKFSDFEHKDNNNNNKENMAGTPVLNLLKSMSEEKLRARFLAMPFTNRRVIMAGAERLESVKLISRIAHDASLLEIEQRAASGEWLFTGKKAPLITGIMGAHAILNILDGSDEILNGLEILAAPSDKFIKNNHAVMSLNWHMLFAQWTPIINLDILRINSALRDLERAPYFKALAGVSRFVIAYSNGGFFDDRLSDLVTKVHEIIKNFMIKHRFRGSVDWFIYENYDLRYTDFLNMGTQLVKNSGDDDIAALIALWEECGLDFEPPFTRENLNFELRACMA